MYSPQQLFVWNIDQLREAIKNPTHDALFAASGRLRQLIADEHSLLHQANRETKFKIWFVIVDRPKPTGSLAEGMVYFGGSLSPRFARPHLAQKRVNLDKFLAETSSVINGNSISVLESIRYVANYAGYIHKGRPDTPGTKSLEEISQKIRINDLPTVLNAMRDISDVTVDACQELYSALRA